MTVKTKQGKEIDLSPWEQQIKSNLSLNREPFEQTPVSRNAQGQYWWWDEESNPTLDKRSVNRLIRELK